MFYPYCTIHDNIEVTHTPLNKDGKTLVHIEVPDAKYCFKTVDILVPSYVVSNVIGMTDDEINGWVEYCRVNASLLIMCAAQGGIANAELI